MGRWMEWGVGGLHRLRDNCTVNEMLLKVMLDNTADGCSLKGKGR